MERGLRVHDKEQSARVKVCARTQIVLGIPLRQNNLGIGAD